ncbi:MAG: ABC transporter ATP-binding protein [Rothia sp. (in: high G+C Gram-positive bacteria)]|nr:ABC transporter ATP-binding protein [Rothia sp. (in: high G+C Gram-positive bacteria)]
MVGADSGAQLGASEETAAPRRPHRGVPIAAQDFGWHYAGRDEPAFSGLTFDIPAGQKVLLLGHSGAGKSTLLHAMAGVAHDSDGQSASGSLTVDGIDAVGSRVPAGLMQQDPESSIVLARVGDDVAFGPENLGVPREQIWQRVDEALAAVGLGHLPLDHPTSALSGGQKQRLGLAGILAMHPGALLLDEPTANLDPAGVGEVRDAVLAAQAATGATLVVIEHRVGIWAQHMDRIIVLGKTGITHDGPPETVLAEARQELIEAGVWVPGYLPPLPSFTSNPGTELLSARGLVTTRTFPTKREIRRRARALKSSGAASYPLDLPAVGRVPAVKVCAGQHLAITGENGTGKSTLALTLAGLLYPADGYVNAAQTLRAAADAPARLGTVKASEQAGWDPARWSPQELITRIGVVFQEPEHQFLTRSVRAELEYGPRQLAKLTRTPLDEEELAHRTDRLLARLRLTHLADANPFTLSGGEKRRLSVATALATAPRLLVLDEPTFGQDAGTWAELVTLLRELIEQGTAVLSVTHDQDFIEALGGERLHLEKEKA